MLGANFNAPVTNNDLTYESQSQQEEHLERTRLAFGHPDWLTESNWGIVASTDPALAVAGDSNPGSLSGSGVTLSVTPVLAVTKNGWRVHLTSALTGVSVASTEVGAVNVATVKYVTANPDSQSLSEYRQPVYKRRITPEPEDVFLVYTLSQWQALSSDEQDDHVVLGTATVQLSSGGSKELLIDMTQTSYSWVRPWFSVTDLEHRSKVGTGTVSDTNVHGNSFNDFNVGDFTLPQLMLRVGAVAAQPQSLPNVPGQLCVTDIPNGSIKIDTFGIFGSGVGARYVELPFYPIRLGKVCNLADEDDEFCFRMVPKTNIIVQCIYSSPPTTESLRIYASKVTALQPQTITDTPVTKVSVGSISSKELVLAGGKAYVNSSSVSLTDEMEDAGPLPMIYHFFFQDGVVIKNPQVLVCRTLLSDIGGGVTPSANQLGQGLLMVALDNAAPGASLSVKVRLSGKDIDGNSIDELITFDNTWSQRATDVTCAMPTTQLQRTSTALASGQSPALAGYFAELTSVTLEESLNAGEDAAIQVWAVMHPNKTEGLRYACPISHSVWDGTKLCTNYDARNVVTDLQSIQAIDTELASLASSISGLAASGNPIQDVILLENFRNPQYGSLVDPDWDDWGASLGNPWAHASDGGQHGLWGFYQSRAMPRLGRSDGFNYVILLPFSTQLTDERSSIRFPVSPNVYFSVQDDGGVWSSWLTGTSASTNTNRAWISPYTPSDYKAIRIRITNAFGYLGMAVTETWSL
jgi:hypothetical protein